MIDCMGKGVKSLRSQIRSPETYLQYGPIWSCKKSLLVERIGSGWNEKMHKKGIPPAIGRILIIFGGLRSPG
jgi:hypothetical protein